MVGKIPPRKLVHRNYSPIASIETGLFGYNPEALEAARELDPEFLRAALREHYIRKEDSLAVMERNYTRRYESLTAAQSVDPENEEIRLQLRRVGKALDYTRTEKMDAARKKGKLETGESFRIRVLNGRRYLSVPAARKAS